MEKTSGVITNTSIVKEGDKDPVGRDYLYSVVPQEQKVEYARLALKSENIKFLEEKMELETTNGLLEINRLHFTLGKGQITIRTPPLTRRNTRVDAWLAKR